MRNRENKLPSCFFVIILVLVDPKKNNFKFTKKNVKSDVCELNIHNGNEFDLKMYLQVNNEIKKNKKMRALFDSKDVHKL